MFGNPFFGPFFGDHYFPPGPSTAVMVSPYPDLEFALAINRALDVTTVINQTITNDLRVTQN